MKKDALDAAIHIGQLIRVLSTISPSAERTFGKRLAQVRSSVDELVVHGVISTDAEVVRKAEAALLGTLGALVDGVLAHIDVMSLLKKAKAGTPVYPGSIVKSGIRPQSLSVGLFDEAKFPEKLHASAYTQEARAQVLHAYASAIKNSSWIPTFLLLKVGARVAAVENAVWMAEFSSHQGREGLPETLRALGVDAGAKPAKRSRSKTLVVPAAGLFDTVSHVRLNVESVLAVPEVAELAAVGLEASVATAFSEALERAAAPVEVPSGKAPEEVAQGVLNTLLNDLKACKKSADAARAAAEKAALTSAVAELKKIDPKLLRMLRNNPSLLKQL
ncbi:TPA: hypothetical protein QDB04_002248 [Burkholderia vietnamiensis]|nr:hypothetical protein [Burkholderia vietnamiensis]